MTKRSFNDAFDDLTTDLTSTVIKRAKTVDYSPFIDIVSAAVSVLSAVSGVDTRVLQDEIINVDNDSVCRVLDNVEKMMTGIKNGSHPDTTGAGSAPPPSTTATPEEDHNG